MSSVGRLPGPYTQTVRALRLFVALQSKPIGYQLGELAREHGVDPRTIRRDVAAMAAAGFDVSVRGSQVWLRKAPPG